jgi:hypothetical protein
MSEKSNPVSQKARDEAIRALASHGGLTPGQISELKLGQVHLATGTLTVQPGESAPADQPATLKLDSNMHRAIIAWLVVRPDSSNDHLFPGAGLAGLDVTIIREVVAAAAAAKPPAPASPPPGKPAEGVKPPAHKRANRRGLPRRRPRPRQAGSRSACRRPSSRSRRPGRRSSRQRLRLPTGRKVKRLSHRLRRHRRPSLCLWMR